jgi:ElaB/YqjD/DUF883 family membrane-anchored ribosome-binding protein
MDAARSAESAARHAGEEIQEKVTEGLSMAQDRMEETVRRGADQARRAMNTLNDQFGDSVRQSPVLALAGAFAVGYLAARIFRIAR